MNGIHPPVTAPETALLEQAAAPPMLAQVESWASINSGSRNLTGLAAMATTLADAFSVLPGAIDLIEPDPVETVAPDGRGEEGQVHEVRPAVACPADVLRGAPGPPQVGGGCR